MNSLRNHSNAFIEAPIVTVVPQRTVTSPSSSSSSPWSSSPSVIGAVSSRRRRDAADEGGKPSSLPAFEVATLRRLPLAAERFEGVGGAAEWMSPRTLRRGVGDPNSEPGKKSGESSRPDRPAALPLARGRPASDERCPPELKSGLRLARRAEPAFDDEGKASGDELRTARRVRSKGQRARDGGSCDGCSVLTPSVRGAQAVYGGRSRVARGVPSRRRGRERERRGTARLLLWLRSIVIDVHVVRHGASLYAIAVGATGEIDGEQDARFRARISKTRRDVSKWLAQGRLKASLYQLTEL